MVHIPQSKLAGDFLYIKTDRTKYGLHEGERKKIARK
jgi:hypothetical protein